LQLSHQTLNSAFELSVFETFIFAPGFVGHSRLLLETKNGCGRVICFVFAVVHCAGQHEFCGRQAFIRPFAVIQTEGDGEFTLFTADSEKPAGVGPGPTISTHKQYPPFNQRVPKGRRAASRELGFLLTRTRACLVTRDETTTVPIQINAATPSQPTSLTANHVCDAVDVIPQAIHATPELIRANPDFWRLTIVALCEGACGAILHISAPIRIGPVRRLLKRREAVRIGYTATTVISTSFLD